MIRSDLIYKDECYKIIGIIFDVFNDIGYGHKEKFCQNAIAEAFKENNINFKRELKARISYKGKEVGYYMFDFLVYNKIVVELKHRNYFTKKDIDQLYSYLKAMKLKLGMLVYFTRDGIRYKRIVNLD
jgi:GxxExxY protein